MNLKTNLSALAVPVLLLAIGAPAACKKKGEEAKPAAQTGSAGGTEASAAPKTPGVGVIWKAETLDKVPFELPLGLNAELAHVPDDNPITPEKVILGRLLYFDPRLSADATISCATCHIPDYQWTEPRPVSEGIRGRLGTRRAPTVINRLFSKAQFWDGRAADLEEQAIGPIANPIEMGFTHDAAVERIQGIDEYVPYFKDAFGDEQVTIGRIAQAIATFERTVVSGNSPYDRWQQGDEDAVGESAKRGHAVFMGKGLCIACHSGMNFTDERYHNLGVGWDKENPDLGRFTVTGEESDKGAFKTPGLRNVALRPPYMHDGSEETLMEVVEFYDKGGNKNPHLSPLMRPLGLTEQEKKDLVAFMEALAGEVTQVQAPEVFPGGWKPGDPLPESKPGAEGG